MKLSYDGRRFASIRNSSGGEVGHNTVFHYHQNGDLVWAEYSGGDIRLGQLVAIRGEDGILDMRYQHVNCRGELKTGKCRSTPEVLSDGRIRLHEKWEWTCDNGSSGESMVEEIN